MSVRWAHPPPTRGYRYIIGFHNFHVITRYNSSINYAMAVTELARRIRRQRAP